MEFIYKKQGDGRDSWFNGSEMVFELSADNWKIKYVLSQRSLLTQVETALNSLPEPNKTKALLAWDYANIIHTSSNTTKFVQSVLCLTIEQVTEIFTEAINLDI